MLASKVKHDWMKGDFIGLYRFEEKMKALTGVEHIKKILKTSSF